MRKLVLIAIILHMATIAMGEVSTRVCLADGNTPLGLAGPNTPFVYRDVMVGTKLTIIVDSNAAGQWDGGLFIEDPYRDYGILSGRDYNDVTFDWEGSRFEAASEEARVYDFEDDLRSGFDLYGHRTAVPGRWFIIDYTATQIGQCKVGFYDYSGPGGINFPVYYLVFSHVPTRDFDTSTNVDLADFGIFALYWQETTCNEPDWCGGADLNNSGNVNFHDLMLFADYWLERTE